MHAGTDITPKHGDDEPSVVNAVESHVAMATLKIALTYGFLWGPSIIYYSLIAVCKDQCFPEGYFKSDTEQYMGFLVKLFIFADCVAAPLIYCINHRDFKKSAKTMLLPAYGAIKTNSRSNSLLSVFKLQKLHIEAETKQNAIAD